jgi:hypothetical protein
MSIRVAGRRQKLARKAIEDTIKLREDSGPSFPLLMMLLYFIHHFGSFYLIIDFRRGDAFASV